MTEHARDDSGTGRSPWEVLAPVMDLVTPMALRTAATLRLADLMGEGPVGVTELAARSETHPDALRRLLRQLASRGVFVESPADTYGLNEPADLLRSDHASGMRTWLDLDGFGGQMDLAFTGVLHTVRTGEPAWEAVFGAPFWEYLAANPGMSASFDATMSAGSEYVVDAARGVSWNGAGHLVDVGGGNGALLAELLRGHPQARATLVDLPDTVQRGRDNLVAHGLADRCEFVGQSFFDPLPAGADLYLLSGVIHDWPDAEAEGILRRCAQAAAPRGRVLIIESHGTSGMDPVAFAEMDLRMLVLCGGRERTVEGYTALAAAAGLRVIDVRTTDLGHVLLDCVPADH